MLGVQQPIGTPLMGSPAMVSPMGMGASPMGMGMGASPMGMGMGASPMGMGMGASPMGMGASPMGMGMGASPMGMGMGASPMGMGASPMGMGMADPMGMGMGMASPMGMGMGMSMGYSRGMMSDLFDMSKLKTSFNYGNRKSLKILIIIGTILLLINSLLWSFLPYDTFCNFLSKLGINDCMDKKIFIIIALASLFIFDVLFYVYFRNPIYSRRFLIMMLILNVLIITASYVINIFLYKSDQSKLK
jgi:hypothetical protein